MGMGGEDHQFHAMDFLVYAYLQTGHEAEARKVIEEVKAMPPHKMEGMDYDERLASQARFEASYVLELHDWREAASLLPLTGVDPDYNLAISLARALGAARSNQVAEARKEIDALKVIEQTYRDKKRTGYANFLDRQINEPLAWIAHTEGKDDDAIKMLRTVAGKEAEGFSDTGFLPAQELLGDLLLEAKRPQEALVEYQTSLKLNPNRFDSLYGAGQAAEQAGKQKEASDYYAQLLKSCEGASSTRAELTRAKELLAKK
jgi:tetratricopeptide (TPR) repeat protein